MCFVVVEKWTYRLGRWSFRIRLESVILSSMQCSRFIWSARLRDADGGFEHIPASQSKQQGYGKLLLRAHILLPQHRDWNDDNEDVLDDAQSASGICQSIQINAFPVEVLVPEKWYRLAFHDCRC